MQKKKDRPGGLSCSMVDYPAPESILQKNMLKRNLFNLPSSVCEVTHKTNCLYQPPSPVGFSLEKKEKMKKS